MPRPPRTAPAGYVYHVINRGFLKAEISADDEDYECFIGLLASNQVKYGMRICAYCLMPNHWHLALWPHKDHIVSRFMQRLTSEHVAAWRKRWGTEGHLYQGRFRSFPVQNERYYYRLIQYIEQNPTRAKLCEHGCAWRWSSAWLREQEAPPLGVPVLSNALPLPSTWKHQLNIPMPQDDLRRIRVSTTRSQPYGDEEWVNQTAAELKLEGTVRTHGGLRLKRAMR